MYAVTIINNAVSLKFCPGNRSCILGVRISASEDSRGSSCLNFVFPLSLSVQKIAPDTRFSITKLYAKYIPIANPDFLTQITIKIATIQYNRVCKKKKGIY